MPTVLGIVNRALTEIAARQPITGVYPTFDNSAAGVAAAQLYIPAVQTLLRQQDWEFSRAVEPLVLMSATPPLGWAFQYLYPDTCLRVRQIVPATFDPNDPSAVTWDVGNVPTLGIIDATAPAFNGSGYAIGDTGGVNGTTGLIAEYRVNTIGAGGSVITYDILPPGGSGYSTGLATTQVGFSQPGVGSGFVINITATTSTSQRVIWTNEAAAELVMTTSTTTELDWDPVFAETVVRYLGSMLAMPIGGRPDFSRIMLEQAGGLGTAGRDRDS